VDYEEKVSVIHVVAAQAHRPLIRDLSPPVVPPVLPGTAQENGDTAMEEVEDGELEDEKLPLQPHAPAHLPNGAPSQTIQFLKIWFNSLLHRRMPGSRQSRRISLICKCQLLGSYYRMGAVPTVTLHFVFF
jgi:hypothetical protein